MDVFFNHVYDLDQQKKRDYLLKELNQTIAWHYANSSPYQKLLDTLGLHKEEFNRLDELPMLPVQLFKLADLYTGPREQIIKVLTSSGTTSQQVSKIHLDRETSLYQTKALVSIVSSFIGSQRLPMIILDTKSVLSKRSSFNARGAGILGFSNFGRDHLYLLDDDYNIKWDELEQFRAKHQGEKILLFGFTFVIWKYVYQAVLAQNKTFDFGDSILFHGGGWKKLADEQVDNYKFNELLRKQLGIRSVHNYYGMVEQVGSIFMECEQGYMHAPSFSEVIIRDPVSLEVLPAGREGLVEVISVLPKSYPGNVLLTEDLGTVFGTDTCNCGRKGTFFSIKGRLPAAELRGCSDVYAN
ncbi:acyl-protein synthetase [Brevibacillus fulvus]|uniref:Phenylacetate-coenzyme A ligase PaaK-like adenylate-forming protein n=1 Tax=Brevibacillus fulvus TaxID=1125967 RepID=A0A939BW65_9BACL|nr:acyl-protein synthetase [Brevibacillus fulvus]MBM7591481.1 phenylacetate-coenzyme A ligase PaaK-like adenylate-forming protein [Brevibacillus fulvus]